MAKRSGLGQQFYVHGFDLSGDVGGIQSADGTREVLDVTAINKSAVERLQSRADGQITFNSWFNDAAGQQHAALKSLPTTDRAILYAMGDDVGDPALFMVAKQINYPWTRGPDGSLQATIQAMVNGVAPEWGVMLTAGKITHASATDGANKDDGASGANGLAAVLQVADIDSGTPTVIIQDSADNVAWANLIVFSSVADGSEPIAERKTVTGTVDRHLRVRSAGTFTNLDFAVAYRRGTAQDDTAY